jgi:hypothetical protein
MTILQVETRQFRLQAEYVQRVVDCVQGVA